MKCGKPEEIKLVNILAHFCNSVHYAENENMASINFVTTLNAHK